MVRTAIVGFASLQNCFVNLPISFYGPLLEHGVLPQSIVVCLSFPSPSSPKETSKVYVGWTGMAASTPTLQSTFSSMGRSAGASRTDEVVEIDPQFAADVGIREGERVSISLFRDLPIASSVSVQPVSSDDWEILERNAEDVELNMLSQVRAASEGALVNVWVHGKSLVRLRVDSVMPISRTHRAARLSTDTEVIIAPKLRSVSDEPKELSKVGMPALDGLRDKGASLDERAAQRVLAKKLWRVVPSPALLSGYCGHSRNDVSASVNGRTSPTQAGGRGFEEEWLLSSPPGSIFVGPKEWDLFMLAFPTTKATVTKVPPPTPRSSSNQSSSSANGGNHPPDSNNRTALPDRPTTTAYILKAPANALPRNHIWMSEDVAKALGAEKAFQLVHFSPPPPGSSRPQSPSASRSASSEHIPAQSHSAPSEKPQTASLAGVSEILTSVERHIRDGLSAKAFADVQRADTFAGGHVLLTGGGGSGKTAIARRVGETLSRDSKTLVHTHYVDLSKMSEERIPALRDKMQEWFDTAVWLQPTLLVLDNIDRIFSAEVEHVDSTRSRVLSEALVSSIKSNLAGQHVAVMATAHSQQACHPSLNTAHLFSETVSLKAPDKVARREMLAHFVNSKLSSSKSSLQASAALNFIALATQTEGYSPADLKDLVERAVHQMAVRTSRPPDGSSEEEHEKVELSPIDFKTAQEGFVPLSLRDVKLQKSEVQWSDIGGLHETRRVLRETLEWPTKYAAIFASCPLRLRSGLLLYGYPGCGKTLLASAVAKECGLNFISVKGPELLNKYIGASEQSVRELFERAQAAKPCVLFFDEFDSIAPKRGHDSTGVTDRVVNQMLTQMDGAEGLDGVYVLAATSRPDLIDPALLRPGRLDKSLLCDMPSYEDRLDIIRAVSRKVSLAPTVSVESLAQRTEGFSGADLQALLYNAHLEMIHDSIAAASAGTSQLTRGEGASASEEETGEGRLEFTSFGGDAEANGTTVSKEEETAVRRKLELMMSPERDTRTAEVSSGKKQEVRKTLVDEASLEKAFRSTRPSVPMDELRRLRRIYREFVSGREGKLPNGMASEEIGGRTSLM